MDYKYLEMLKMFEDFCKGTNLNSNNILIAEEVSLVFGNQKLTDDDFESICKFVDNVTFGSDVASLDVAITIKSGLDDNLITMEDIKNDTDTIHEYVEEYLY